MDFPKNFPKISISKTNSMPRHSWRGRRDKALPCLYDSSPLVGRMFNIFSDSYFLITFAFPLQK
jgi:hypothetical protein